MGLFDAILGHAHDHPTVKNMADKLGIDQEQAEQAIAALAEAHQQQGDTVRLAADRTGLSSETLNRVVEQIGGEGSLTQFNQMIEGDHSGNPFDNFNGN
jgi:CTP:molybdopterin cytidylyltransferase MocA